MTTNKKKKENGKKEKKRPKDIDKTNKEQAA